jgi:surface antigen
MGKFRIVAVAFGSLALAACANDSTGLAPGSATGGGSSAFTGSVPSAPGNAAGGPGGLPGGPAAATPVVLDPRDRAAAGAAHLRALQFGEPGAPVPWRSAETGHHGTIVPGPAYQSNGLTCREFSHTVYVDNRPQTARGSACRNPDGTWAPLS